jgi:hypothetical protein
MLSTTPQLRRSTCTGFSSRPQNPKKKSLKTPKRVGVLGLCRNAAFVSLPPRRNTAQDRAMELNKDAPRTVLILRRSMGLSEVADQQGECLFRIQELEFGAFWQKRALATTVISETELAEFVVLDDASKETITSHLALGAGGGGDGNALWEACFFGRMPEVQQIIRDGKTNLDWTLPSTETSHKWPGDCCTGQYLDVHWQTCGRRAFPCGPQCFCPHWWCWGSFLHPTPLMVASATGQYSIAKMLLEAGADPTVPVSGGCTPSCLACCNLHPCTFALLRSEIKSRSANQGGFRTC